LAARPDSSTLCQNVRKTRAVTASSCERSAGVQIARGTHLEERSARELGADGGVELSEAVHGDCGRHGHDCDEPDAARVPAIQPVLLENDGCERGAARDERRVRGWADAPGSDDAILPHAAFHPVQAVAWLVDSAGQIREQEREERGEHDALVCVAHEHERRQGQVRREGDTSGRSAHAAREPHTCIA
jgi:hypothetical protein